jgi:hypothetical protein
MLDGVAMMPYSEVGRIANEPEAPMHTVTATQTLGALTPELMEQVLEATADPTHTTLLLVAFRHLEGAYRRLPEGASAVSRPDLDFLMIAVGVVMAPEARQKVTADAHRLVELTRPFQTGTPLRNFLTANSADRATGLELFVEAKYARLNEVKRRFDPANRFRFNIPLRPASETATAVA